MADFYNNNINSGNGIDLSSEEYDTEDFVFLYEEGLYEARISAAEIKLSKKDNTQMWCFVWEFTNGKYKGRKVFDNLCVFHSNPDVATMAKRKLKQLCQLKGLWADNHSNCVINSPNELLGLIAMLDIKIKESKEGDKMTNTWNYRKYQAPKLEKWN